MPAGSNLLQDFVDAALEAFLANVTAEDSRTSVLRCVEDLQTINQPASAIGSRLPASEEHLSVAIEPTQFDDPLLRHLVQTFADIEPLLTWERKVTTGLKTVPGFEDGHANAFVIGPGGLEARQDVWLGATLIAPNIRYPDHSHPPEETYLVMSGGEFWQDGGPWFEPGVGGSLYNRPNVLHAMRAGSNPLFAFWLLRTD